MTIFRLRSRRGRAYGRASYSRRTFVLLVALRLYAIAAVGIALYAFVKSLLTSAP